MFNRTDPFGDYTYPLTTEELLEAHGGYELELADGTETLAEVLEIVGSETFETTDDLRYAIYGAVSSKAIGRKGYSDRDAPSPGELGQEPVSF